VKVDVYVTTSSSKLRAMKEQVQSDPLLSTVSTALNVHIDVSKYVYFDLLALSHVAHVCMPPIPSIPVRRE
jgi:hypothetical protein